MARRIFDIASIVSLLLCVGIGTLWMRSNELEDFSVWRSFDRSDPAMMDARAYWIIYGEGAIELAHMHNRHAIEPRSNFAPDDGFTHYTTPQPAHPDSVFDGSEITLGGYGFTFSRVPEALVHRGNWAGWSVTTPFWPWIVIASVLPLVNGFLRLRKHQRQRHGRCTHCTYDLTGNVSGVCPECGATVETSTSIVADEFAEK